MNKFFLRETDGKSNISVNVLKKLANTKKLRDILYNYIENETIPSVRAIWIEYFFETKNKKL